MQRNRAFVFRWATSERLIPGLCVCVLLLCSADLELALVHPPGRRSGLARAMQLAVLERPDFAAPKRWCQPAGSTWHLVSLVPGVCIAAAFDGSLGGWNV